jgi:hypothetical protein
VQSQDYAGRDEMSITGRYQWAAYLKIAQFGTWLSIPHFLSEAYAILIGELITRYLWFNNDLLRRSLLTGEARGRAGTRHDRTRFSDTERYLSTDVVMVAKLVTPNSLSNLSKLSRLVSFPK